VPAQDDAGGAAQLGNGIRHARILAESAASGVEGSSTGRVASQFRSRRACAAADTRRDRR
jgi:hypothetical protein